MHATMRNASERRGNNLKRFEDLNLEDNAMSGLDRFMCAIFARQRQGGNVHAGDDEVDASQLGKLPLRDRTDQTDISTSTPERKQVTSPHTR